MGALKRNLAQEGVLGRKRKCESEPDLKEPMSGSAVSPNAIYFFQEAEIVLFYVILRPIGTRLI
jgi:hypothetical protein